MEDFPNEDQEDKKKKKKRRLPSFLSTWLSRTAEGDQESKESKKPFSERAWKVFQSFFSREAEAPEKIEEKPEAQTRPDREFAVPATERVAAEQVSTQNSEETMEKQLPERKPELSDKPEQQPAEVTPNEDGELVIDHYDEEAEDTLPGIEEMPEYEQPPEFAPPLMPLPAQAEMTALYEQETGGPIAAGQPEKIGDVLERRQKQNERDLTREKQRNRRRNRKLKKQVRELKHEAETKTKQQESLKKEQSGLKEQVERLRQQPEVSTLIARQERERAELRANRGMVNVLPESKPAERPAGIKTEAAAQRSYEQPQPRYQQPEARRETSQSVEMIIPQMERDAQADTRSEREFERRHEVKDEAGSAPAATYSALATADAAHRAAAAQVQQAAAAARSYQPPQPAASAPQPAFQASDLVDSPMYRQAMRNGFFTAVILLAIWLVISMVR